MLLLCLLILGPREQKKLLYRYIEVWSTTAKMIDMEVVPGQANVSLYLFAFGIPVGLGIFPPLSGIHVLCFFSSISCQK